MFLKSLHSRVALSSSVNEDTAIPKTLHQTWFSKKINRFLHSEIETFWNLNNDLNITIYDDDDCDAFMRGHWSGHPIYDIYSRSNFGPMKADIFRYCVIATFGGFYCDISKTLTKSFSTFCDTESTGLISYEGNQFFLPVSNQLAQTVVMPQNYICNWAFGFSKEHPFLRLLINKIVALAPRFDGRVFEDPKAAIVTHTGPGVFTQCMQEYLMSSGDRRIVQMAPDFGGCGIYNSRMSRLRYFQKSSYKAARDRPILR